jgi:hypothetical protein
MYRRIFIFLLVLAVTLSVGVVPAAARAETYHFSSKGLTAYADFFSWDGCVETYASISATDGKVKQTGKPAVVSEVWVYVSAYNYCTDEYLSADGYASLAADEFQINRGLGTATLVTTINVYDYYNGNSFPLSIDLTWTGSGGVYQEKYHSQYRAPGYSYNSRWMGTFRDALASGSVSGAGIEFAQEPTYSAQLANVKQGSVDIIK